MKVRMIFAHEYLPEGSKEPRLLKVDEKHDLDDGMAAVLIDRGIAEPTEPRKTRKSEDK